MSERGILFRDRLVRAILAGRKTQTRRLVRLPLRLAKMGGDLSAASPDLLYGVTPGLHVPCRVDQSVMPLRNPWGFIPPQLRDSENAGGQPVNFWVREAHAVESNYGVASADEYPPPFSDGRPVRWHDGRWWEQCHYRATDPTPELVEDAGTGDPGCRWCPSIFMPRWASRILLRVLSIRAERLQDISEEDAIAEGPEPVRTTLEPVGVGHEDRASILEWRGDGLVYRRAREAFASLWDSINGKKSGASWEDNPWCWAITFERSGA